MIPDEQNFISQTISPDNGRFLIGARTLLALKTGEALFWNELCVGLTLNQCQQACQWVADSGDKKLLSLLMSDGARRIALGQVMRII